MTQSAYKQAGVDIDEAAALVERIKPHVKKTNRSGVMSGLGGFGAMFDLKATGYKDPVLVSSTDGVGTKLKIAIDMDKHDTIGIDAVAMCVNDLVVQGAEPLFFLDYFATGKLVNNVAEDVIAGIAKGCAQSGCALIGGETAEMPGMYAAGDYDIAGFTVGAVERDRIITGETISEGDVILGLASNGLHSNGFSLVRHLVDNMPEASYDSIIDNGKTFGELALIPTRIYVKPLLETLKIKDASGKPAIKGMAHITGGGLSENVPRVLPENVTACIDISSWELPAIFRWLAKLGNISPEDIVRTLNCGIGMIAICSSEHAQEIKTSLEEQGESVFKIGKIKKRDVSDQTIIFENLNNFWN